MIMVILYSDDYENDGDDEVGDDHGASHANDDI